MRTRNKKPATDDVIPNADIDVFLCMANEIDPHADGVTAQLPSDVGSKQYRAQLVSLMQAWRPSNTTTAAQSMWDHATRFVLDDDAAAGASSTSKHKQQISPSPSKKSKKELVAHVRDQFVRRYQPGSASEGRAAARQDGRLLASVGHPFAVYIKLMTYYVQMLRTTNVGADKGVVAGGVFEGVFDFVAAGREASDAQKAEGAHGASEFHSHVSPPQDTSDRSRAERRSWRVCRLVTNPTWGGATKVEIGLVKASSASPTWHASRRLTAQYRICDVLGTGRVNKITETGRPARMLGSVDDPKAL